MLASARAGQRHNKFDPVQVFQIFVHRFPLANPFRSDEAGFPARPDGSSGQAPFLRVSFKFLGAPGKDVRVDIPFRSGVALQNVAVRILPERPFCPGGNGGVNASVPQIAVSKIILYDIPVCFAVAVKDRFHAVIVGQYFDKCTQFLLGCRQINIRF